MDLFILLLICAVAALYFAPYIFVSLRASLPIFMLKNTILFGLIGLVFSFGANPFPIMNVFVGMIAGSLVDYLISKKRHG